MSTTYIATQGDRKVIIRHTKQYDEYKVQFFLRNPKGDYEYMNDADYFTGDWTDAIGTANHWLKEPTKRLEEFNVAIEIAEELRDFALAIANNIPQTFDAYPYWKTFEHDITDILEKQKYPREALEATEEESDFWYDDEEFWNNAIQYLKDRR